MIDDLEEPKRIRRADPVTKYDYCKIFAGITKRPIGLFLKETKHYPMEWMYEIASLCKEKTREQQAKIINWYVREARAKPLQENNLK